MTPEEAGYVKSLTPRMCETCEYFQSPNICNLPLPIPVDPILDCCNHWNPKDKNDSDIIYLGKIKNAKILNKLNPVCPIMDRKAKLQRIKLAQLEKSQPLPVRIAILKDRLLKAKLGNNYETYKKIEIKLAKLRVAAGEFKENDHPRDEGGQFTCKDCGASGPKSEEAAHAETHSELSKLQKMREKETRPGEQKVLDQLIEKQKTNKGEKKTPKSMSKTKGLDTEKKKFTDPDRPYSTGLTGKQQKAIEKHLDTKVTDAFHGDSRGSVYVMQDGSEYLIYPDSRAAELATKSYVKSMLEDEPETFNQDFIEQHIDTERLKRDLHSDVEESLREMVNDNPEEYGLSKEDTQGGPNGRDWTKVEGVLSSLADEQLSDPVQYLKDLYGDEDGVKQAIELGGIDIDAAADDAISTDGAAHFMSSYDGEEVELDDGTIMYRVN